MSQPEAKPVDVCHVVVAQADTYLLVQEALPHVYGLWNFPGGHPNPGESLTDAAVREAQEEAGVEVKIDRLLYKADRPEDNRVLHAFLGEIVGGELRPRPGEILDVRLFSYEEILAMEAELRDPRYIIGALKLARNL